MGRVLGLDYGEKRIGVAVSDPLHITAQALAFIPNDEKAMDALSALVFEYEVDKLVIGLPKNREGEDSKTAAYVRQFAKDIGAKLGLPIEFWDERYSTQAVERHLIGADVSRKKRKQSVDSLAAQFILQGYMDL